MFHDDKIAKTVSFIEIQVYIINRLMKKELVRLNIYEKI